MAASAEEMKKHLKIYYAIFGALLVLTGVTVAVAELNVPVFTGILIALLVAGLKGSLVACYFMHLISERGMIYGILLLCALFFIVILLLPVITQHDNPQVKFIDSVSGIPIGG